MIQILVTSSIMILVLVLLRRFLRKKVRQRLIYSLWLLVALRLLVPLEFGQSVYSLAAVTQPAAQQMQQAISRPISGPDQEALYQQLLLEYMAQRPADTAPVSPEVQTQLRQEAQARERLSYMQLLRLVWLAGVGVMGLWFAVTNLRFLAKLRRGSRPWRGRSRIPVRVGPQVPSPCLVGLFRPVIFITPESLKTDGTLRHILTHETMHWRHKDPLWSLVRCLCLCIYWFHPLVWVAALLSKQDCELACDEAALEALGGEARIPYGKTLLGVTAYARAPGHMMELATSMGESKKHLKERLGFIVRKPKTFLTAAIALVLAAVLITGCAFVGDRSGAPDTSLPPASQTQASSTGTLPLGTAGNGGLPDWEEMSLIAADLIARYNRLCAVGIGCDYELVLGDLSHYMTQQQRDLLGDKYCDQQWKLTCCSTPEEVEAHCRRIWGGEALDLRQALQLLFTDDAGNLYLPIIPSEMTGYAGVRLWNIRAGQAVALADAYFTNAGNIPVTMAFFLRQKDDHWYIADQAAFCGAQRQLVR